MRHSSAAATQRYIGIELQGIEAAIEGHAASVPAAAKKWVCTVCGYVHEGDNPPENCPLCHVPAEKFNETK